MGFWVQRTADGTLRRLAVRPILSCRSRWPRGRYFRSDRKYFPTTPTSLGRVGAPFVSNGPRLGLSARPAVTAHSRRLVAGGFRNPHLAPRAASRLRSKHACGRSLAPNGSSSAGGAPCSVQFGKLIDFAWHTGHVFNVPQVCRGPASLRRQEVHWLRSYRNAMFSLPMMGSKRS